MYPVWEGVFVHSAMYIAIIAVFHVIVSHLTVAASWFNLFLEYQAVHKDRPELYEYLKRSALGLLVFAYTGGAMAGVGIWQSTTAANPRGISTLIHNFVLFWGSEWYMFLIDVVGIIAYYYTFGRVDKKTHLRIATILALGGTGTLTLIVGILAFKLSPGPWIESGQPLVGFFNHTFWPQFFLRLSVMFVITAAWAILISSGLPRGYPAREQIVRYASLMGLAGLIYAGWAWTFWLHPSLPPSALIILESAAIPPITFTIIYLGVGATFLGLIYAYLSPESQHRLTGIVALVVLFSAIFGAERTREVMRKPDVVAGYMSSNQLIFADMPARGIWNEEDRLNRSGLLGELPFLPSAAEIGSSPLANMSGDEAHQIAVGRVLVLQQCAACHSVSDQTSVMVGDNQLTLRSLAVILTNRGQSTPQQIESYIGGIQGFPYMHPVVGKPEERAAMASYLAYFRAMSVSTASANGGQGGR